MKKKIIFGVVIVILVVFLGWFYALYSGYWIIEAEAGNRVIAGQLLVWIEDSADKEKILQEAREKYVLPSLVIEEIGTLNLFLINVSFTPSLKYALETFESIEGVEYASYNGVKFPN